MHATRIDQSRPIALYLSFTAVLLVASILLGRLPVPSVASLLSLPYAKHVAGALLVLSVLVGVAGAASVRERAKHPWRVPQSQSLILFLAFLILGSLGLVLSI